MRFSIPAIVVGAGINGLGVVRSLAERHIPAIVLDADEQQPAMKSRTARHFKLPTMAGIGFIHALIDLAKRRFEGQRPVLLLTQEHTVKLVSDYRDLLSTHFRFTLPQADVLQQLMHKESFHRYALQSEFPVPKTAHIKNSADIRKLEELQFPIVAKPGQRNADYDNKYKKANRFDTVESAERWIRPVLSVMPDIVVQEWIEGPDSSIYFCLQCINPNGDVVASFTGRKIRSWPPQVGGTASCMEALEEHAFLSELTANFFKRAGAFGLLGMEYKKHSRTGTMMMVEPTIGRTDYQEEVATLNGVNLPAAAYCCELNLPLGDGGEKRQPVAWRVSSDDARSFALQGPSGYTIPKGTKVVDALWRLSDPLPYADIQGRRLCRALVNKLGKD